MWIKTSQKGVRLLGKGDGDYNWEWFEKALYIDDGGGQVAFSGRACGGIGSTTDVNVADGGWHHLAVTFNGGVAPGDREIYVDGINRTYQPCNYNGRADSGDVFRLGSADLQYDDRYQDYTGLMDDVYLYDRSLSAAEVGDVYAAFGGALDPLPSANLRVTADSALRIETMLEKATLGDVAVDPGVALRISGAAVHFHDVTVGNGASIQGDLSVGGTLSPGDSPGTFSVVGKLEMDESSSYLWELGDLAVDVVAVGGDLKLMDGWTLRLADAGGTCVASDQIDLFTYTGSLDFRTCVLDGSEVASSGRWDWSGATVHYDQNRVYLTGLTVVPEPGTLMMLLSGAMVLLCVLRPQGRQGSGRSFPL